VESLTIWIIDQLAEFASQRVFFKKSDFILDDALQSALRNPTEVALSAAVDAVLGENASPEARQGAFENMAVFWTPDLKIGAGGSTLTEALQEIVAQAIGRANAPSIGRSPEDTPTTTLTSLSDELGIRIDGDAFAAVFIDAWLDAVRKASLANEVLQPLADLLAHEQSQVQAERNHAATQAPLLGREQRLNETLMSAVQSAYEQGVRKGGATIERRLQWFEIHVAPADKLMHEIHDDYRSAFNSALDALRSGDDLEDAMRRLEALRERKVAGRRGAVIAARKLLQNRPDAVFGASLDAPLTKYLEAVQGFQRSDAELDTTWYGAYIEKFNRLITWGEDPHLRSNYPAISAVEDLKGQLAVAIAKVLNTTMPKKWDEYLEAYQDLRHACVAGPPSRPAGAVTTALRWDSITDEGFERLLFNLLRGLTGYENVQWLMKTNAADHGRDLSLERTWRDASGLMRRERVVVQAKHWRRKSVDPASIVNVIARLNNWEPPHIHCLIVATSGSFTADAVQYVERYNEKGADPRIEMWSGVDLEALLAERPELTATSGLRPA
jgi:hypothetical protein